MHHEILLCEPSFGTDIGSVKLSKMRQVHKKSGKRGCELCKQRMTIKFTTVQCLKHGVILWAESLLPKQTLLEYTLMKLPYCNDAVEAHSCVDTSSEIH